MFFDVPDEADKRDVWQCCNSPASHAETEKRRDVGRTSRRVAERQTRRRSIVFAALHQLLEASTKMPKRADVVPSDRRPVVRWCRRVFDALVQVFKKRQSPNVGSGVFGFDSLAVGGAGH